MLKRFGGIHQSIMKITKEPIREDRYLNIKLDTYPIDFSVLDSIFYDLGKFAYGIVINDGEKEVFLEFSSSKSEALQKHKEYYDRLTLRPDQWFDVKKKKFVYLKYKDVEEKINDVTSFASEDVYSLLIRDIQQLIVRGSNNGLTFYTKREATDYSRRVAFSIFSGLRVKIGQLRNTSYSELKQIDAREVDSLVKQTDKYLAERFMNEMYNPGTEQHERWEMFIDLLEAKISEYYREGNRNTPEAPNFIIMAEIIREVDARVTITKKPATAGHGDGGGADHAEWEKRFTTNVPGKFYVDEKCIVCDACAATAPNFFELNEQHAFVMAQPKTPEEVELCNQALAGCPVAAIGNDGDIKAAQAAAAPAPAVNDAERSAPQGMSSDKAGLKPEKVEITMDSPTGPAKVSAHVEPTPEGVASVVKQLDNVGSPVLSIKPEEKEKEIEEMKTLMGSVSDDKLLEIRALLRAATLEQQKAALEASSAAPPAEQPAPAEAAAPPAQETAPPGAKPLPETSPNGAKLFPENVPGLFYVDENCIECDACTSEAPNFFVIENGHAYVFAQPTNDKEIAECEAAKAGCPVDAIHKNV
jgi:ferredoxin